MKLQRKEKSELKWFHRWYWFVSAFLVWLLGAIILEINGGGIVNKFAFYSVFGFMWVLMTIVFALSFFKKGE